jgi:hypothetical protein
MKTVEEKLAEYIEVLKKLRSEAQNDMSSPQLSAHSRTLATAESYTLKNIIKQLEKIK